MKRDVEVLIVGGGPVGSALALQLHRAGRDVLLVDAGASPGKVCGEGLLPPGWAALERLGVAGLVTSKAAIEGLSYVLPDPRSGALRTLRAPVTRASFGVRRELLCQAFETALSQEAVPVARPSRFRGLCWRDGQVKVELEQAGEKRQIGCSVLVGADGLHSSVRRGAEMGSTRPRRFARWGCRVYLQNPLCRGVTVTLGEGVESYMTPLGDGLCGLAFLWSPARLGRPLPGEGATWERLLARFPTSVRETLPASTQFFGADRAIGPLQQQVTSPLHASGRIALVGDAGGYLDALTGEGLCLGLLQAEALAALYLNGRLSDYPVAHRAIKQRHQVVVHLLLWLLARPALRERVFGALLRTPELFVKLLRTAVEEQPWQRLVTPDAGRFLYHLLRGDSSL